MEAADPYVNDARRELLAVVGGDRNPAARDFGEVCLAETNVA